MVTERSAYGVARCLRRRKYPSGVVLFKPDVEIVLLPTHASRHDAQRLPSHFVDLIHHQEVRRPSLRLQRLLAVRDGPLQFFRRDEYLAERGVDARLAGVETRRRGNGFLVLEYVPAIMPLPSVLLLPQSQIDKTHRWVGRKLPVVVHTLTASVTLSSSAGNSSLPIAPAPPRLSQWPY